jgi:hypothetical protein
MRHHIRTIETGYGDKGRPPALFPISPLIAVFV